MSIIGRAKTLHSELSALHPYDLEKMRFMGTTVAEFVEMLIEYDQALREALSALEQYGSKKYLSQNIGNNVINKYSHLLKGE